MLINSGSLGCICAFGFRDQIESLLFHLRRGPQERILYGHVEPRIDFAAVVVECGGED